MNNLITYPATGGEVIRNAQHARHGYVVREATNAEQVIIDAKGGALTWQNGALTRNAAPDDITMYQAEVELAARGIDPSAVEAALPDAPARSAWKRLTVIRRTNQLAIGVAATLQISIDDFFISAAKHQPPK